MHCRRSFLFALATVAVYAGLSAAVFGQAAVVEQSDAVVPAPRNIDRWMTRHAGMNERVKQGNVDLLMIGDSITHGWEGRGKEVWAKYYEKRNAVNLGIGGDRTQHVLWRLDNGNIDGISPKLAVLMIGTNNSNSNTSEEIADGVNAIVKKLRTELPKMKVLVLAIFPRGADNNDAKRQVNQKANEIIAKLADGENVFFLDINQKFLTSEGVLTKEVMPDFLHPHEMGYGIWAKAMEPTIAKLMGEK